VVGFCASLFTWIGNRRPRIFAGSPLNIQWDKTRMVQVQMNWVRFQRGKAVKICFVEKKLKKISYSLTWVMHRFASL
jgi:hypothetical protein